MFRSKPWRLCKGMRAPFSTRAWYQMPLKQRSLGKPVGGHSSGKSILAPGKPLSREELLNLLEKSLVHKDDVLLAISKPPGLPVDGKPGEVTLLSLLPFLSQKLGLPQNLQVIKAAGKESSGLVLLSGCADTVHRVHDFYIRSQRAKRPTATYCAITTRIPEASEGEISTGLKLMQIEDFDLVVPVASPSRGSIERREVKKTLTHYKVLDSNEDCALLQLQPLTAFPSQLLVHSTLILSPILGDHMYSSRVGAVLGEPFLLSPESALPRTQILNDSLLTKLHLQQRHVHRLPLHLHLHRLLLPSTEGFSSCAALTAPFPAFFLRTLSLLGLALPQEETKEQEKTLKAFSTTQ
ncbi:mitochondrial mRNA pseudouridine synthase RPUSD3 [Anolis carolinensis]|uniref:mitochondrial mRNA pseudouridine synthase RPUSD3 n=1 Tax=Anolis carolinensis TaxID=28377 RepID=UPI002F2B3864